MQMQVRYADTPAQKELKRITAERRQFRTNEYNIGAYGTADVGVAPSIYNPYGRRSGIGSELCVLFIVTRVSVLLTSVAALTLGRCPAWCPWL